MGKQHDLKCHPHFFAAIVEGKKTFEIRRNDRDYRVGDTLRLREFDPSYGNTGKEAGPFEVVYLMTAEDFPAILPGFVIMGLGGLPEAVTHTSSDEPSIVLPERLAELAHIEVVETKGEHRKYGLCTRAEGCVCGGDTLAVRRTCGHWNE